MGSIRPPLLLILASLAAASLAAQSSGSPGPLSAGAGPTGLVEEIQNIERIVKRPGASGAEKYGALARLARLYRLEGNLEAAARAWNEAAGALNGGARAEPGREESIALLEGALVFIALGEYGEARTNVEAVLSGTAEGETLRRARYVAAQLEAFSRGQLGELLALLEGYEYREYRPAIWYTLWRVSGNEAYRGRLLAEYPASPEGRIAAEAPLAGGSAAVGPLPGAFWFLFPGRENVALGPALAPSQVAVAADIPPGAASLLPPVTTELADLTGARGTASGPLGLQTGLFSREENAQSMVRRLRGAGFSASANRRRVNGADYWAVSVPPGPDMQETIMRLKDAGFEAFPVF